MLYASSGIYVTTLVWLMWNDNQSFLDVNLPPSFVSYGHMRQDM